jgi:hypothetical protein
MSEKAPANAAWGGRFAAGPSAIMQRINVSLDVDKRLYAQDIAASLAHGAMLVRQGIIAPEDGDRIAQGLAKIKTEIEAGSFPFRVEHEDIHLNIEARLARPTSGFGSATPSTGSTGRCGICRRLCSIAPPSMPRPRCRASPICNRRNR